MRALFSALISGVRGIENTRSTPSAHPLANVAPQVELSTNQAGNATTQQ